MNMKSRTLYENPFNSDFDIGGVVPASAESSGFPRDFTGGKGFGDFISENEKGNEFGVDLIGFGASFAG